MITETIFGKRPSDVTVSKITYNTDDFDASESLIEGMIYSEQSYLNIIRENMMALHYGLKDESIEILQEGIGDFFKSIGDFFARMIEKFKEMMKRLFMVINAYMGSFDKFLTKYADELKKLDPDFEIKGFDFSFNGDIPKIDRIHAIIHEFNTDISELGSMSKADVMKEREEFTSESYNNKVRAEVLGSTSSINSENFQAEARKKFRSGTDDEIDIKVNKGVLENTISGYSELKKTYKECTSQRDKIILLLESMRTFFGRGSSVAHSEGEKVIQSHTISVSDSGSSINKDEPVHAKDTSDNLAKINLFYSYKLTQAKELGGITIIAFTEKVNAFKQAIKQSENIIRRSIHAAKVKTSEGSESK